MISRVLYKQITISVSGHCMHFLLKTCQCIAGITLSSQFNEFFGAILWRVFDLWPHLVVASKLGTDKGGTQQLFSDQGVCVMGKSRRICPSTLNFHTQLLYRGLTSRRRRRRRRQPLPHACCWQQHKAHMWLVLVLGYLTSNTCWFLTPFFKLSQQRLYDFHQQVC